MGQANRLAARLGWLGIAVGPPSVVVGSRWHAVSTHALLAVALIALYEGAFATAAYAAAIAGDLGTRWRGRIVERVDHAVRSRLSPFGRTYRELLLADLQRIELRGLPTVGSYTPDLDEVFVDVTVDPRAPHRVPGDLLADEPSGERRSISEFVDRPEPAVLAVIGGPGSGKTTLLRYTAQQVCRAPRGRRRAVPILLYLRDHAAAIRNEPGTTLPDLLRASLGPAAAGEPAGWFDERLGNGECLVLLDGLDEVGRHDERADVVGWIERQIRAYPKNDFVVTSRPLGYRRSRVDGATVLQIRRFSDEQVVRFVRRWYLAAELAEAPSDGPGARSRAAAEAAAEDLLDRLHNSPALRELTVNPLLLTMIAIVHRENRALPGSRVELYREICEVILWRRQEAKGVTERIAGASKEPVLRRVAFTMMERRVRELPYADLLEVVRRALRALPSPAPSAEDFLADVSATGMLAEREREVHGFAHLSFQEYLAATHVAEEGLTRTLLGGVADEWWHLTTMFYVADAGPAAQDVVRACLDSGGPVALALAFDCAEQSAALAEEFGRQLRDLVASALEPGADPARRDVVAQALLARHLRDTIGLGDGGRVAARPVTTSMYRLFLEYRRDRSGGDLPGPGSERTPDPEESSTMDDLDEPAVGVSAEDAVSFVAWVNELRGSDHYRLPTRSEMDDPVALRGFTNTGAAGGAGSVWLGAERAGDRPGLWVPPGAAHPYTVANTVLAAQVQADIAKPSADLARLRLVRAVAVFCARARARELAAAVGSLRDRVRGLARKFNALVSSSSTSTRRRNVVQASLGEAIRDMEDIVEASAELAEDLGRIENIQSGLARELARNDLVVAGLDRLAARLDDPAGHSPPVDDLVRGLERYQERCAAIDAELDPALSTAFRDVFDYLGTGTVDTDRRDRLRQSDFPQRLARNFVDRVRAGTGARTVYPDAVVENMRATCTVLARVLESHEDWPSWSRKVGEMFVDAASSVANGAQPPSPDTVAVLRVASLCLEDAVRPLFVGRKAADGLRDVAAGFTLLERRASGAAPVTEAIVLATRTRSFP